MNTTFKVVRELEERPDPQLDVIISTLKRQGEEVKAPPKHSIIRYGYELAEKMKKAGKAGNGIVYNTAINKLKDFIKTAAFSFPELTYKLLDGWNVSMLAEIHDNPKNGNGMPLMPPDDVWEMAQSWPATG